MIIAHRGASGYLPEHTEGAKVLALAQGADYIEQDVVLSKDGVFVVTHDITMEETTDVEEKFADRVRKDGKYYFADFLWSEIQSLSVHERVNRKTGGPVFAERFPGTFHQKLMRLEDEIALVQGLNQTMGTHAGIYVELKAPEWHRSQLGYHMGDRLIPILSKLGYKADRSLLHTVFRRERAKASKEIGCKLPLIQLFGAGPKGGSDRWVGYLKEIASYAEGIGPSIEALVEMASAGGVVDSGLMQAAREAKLLVHPYTVRKDALPKWSRSLDDLHRLLIHELKVDGFFSDFPDLSCRARDCTFALMRVRCPTVPVHRHRQLLRSPRLARVSAFKDLVGVVGFETVAPVFASNLIRGRC